jgi:hypothetical protein
VRILTKQDPLLVDSPASEHLAHTAERVLKVRSGFLDYLNSLEPPFNNLATRHYLARVVRAEDRYMLGEYIPFLLGDLLDVPEPLVSDIAIPWLVLYEHALLTDDIIDIPKSQVYEELILGQVLFDRFITLWSDRFSSSPSLWQLFSKYHREGLLAAFGEQRQIPETPLMPALEILPECADRHILMGRKAALVKFCGTALSFESKRRFLSSSEEAGLDKLCAGIQLLDDLSDCFEDYTQQRQPYPLSLGLEWLARNHGLTTIRHRVLTSVEVLSVLLLSGVTAHLIGLASQYLSQGLEVLQSSLASPTARYLLSLARNNEYAQSTLEDIIQRRPNDIHTMVVALNEGEQSWNQLMIQDDFEAIWTEMKKCFTRIAVAAN